MPTDRPKLVRAVVVGTVPPGKFEIGGVRVVSAEDDEAAGRELRTVEVRCHGFEELRRLRRVVDATDGLEMTR